MTNLKELVPVLLPHRHVSLFLLHPHTASLIQFKFYPFFCSSSWAGYGLQSHSQPGMVVICFHGPLLVIQAQVANLHPMTGTLKSLLWENCQAFRCKVVVEKVPWANTQELCFSPAAVTHVYFYYLHTSKQRLFLTATQSSLVSGTLVYLWSWAASLMCCHCWTRIARRCLFVFSTDYQNNPGSYRKVYVCRRKKNPFP